LRECHGTLFETFMLGKKGNPYLLGMDTAVDLVLC